MSAKFPPKIQAAFDLLGYFDIESVGFHQAVKNTGEIHEAKKDAVKAIRKYINGNPRKKSTHKKGKSNGR